MITNPFKRWWNRVAPLTHDEETEIRNGAIVEKAGDTEFFKLLLDTIDKFHTEHLAKSESSQWHAGAAFANLQLTRELIRYKRRRDEILRSRLAKEERDKLPPPEYNWHQSEDGGVMEPRSEPVTI